MPRPPSLSSFDFRFGHVPDVWAGRATTLATITASLRDERNEPLRQILLVGPKGTGKTATLRAWHASALQAGWRSVFVTPDPGELAAAVAAACHEQMRRGNRLWRWIKRVEVKAGPVALGAPDEQGQLVEAKQLAVPMQRLARRSRKGVLFLVDEAHSLHGEELRSFGRAYQAAEGNVQDKNFAVVVAGLDSVKGKVALREESSFFKRLKERKLGMLTSDEVEDFVRTTLSRIGRTIDEEALAIWFSESVGWPHVMQLVGYHTMQQAGDALHITPEHVRAGLPDVHREAGQELLAVAWDGLPEAARTLLSNLASDSDTYVDPMDCWNPDEITEAGFRKRLQTCVNSGFLAAVERGRYGFPLPFARTWILNELGLLDHDVARQGLSEGVRTGEGEQSSEAARLSMSSAATAARNGAASKLDAQAAKAKSNERCGHIGVRTGSRCVLPLGHRGQHRYG